MDEKTMLGQLEEMMDIDQGCLTPDTVLNDLDEWDSLSKLSLIVLMDDEYGKKINGEEVRKFNTVADILAYMR